METKEDKKIEDNGDAKKGDKNEIFNEKLIKELDSL